MYDELRELNRTWRDSFFARPHEADLVTLEASGIRFLWDTTPDGWLRFCAFDADGTPRHAAAAWPGASKWHLVTQVIEALAPHRLLPAPPPVSLLQEEF